MGPTLSTVSGTGGSDHVYYVSIAWVTSANGVQSESPASMPLLLDVPAGDLLQVTPPAAPSGAIGYNVYVSTSPGMEELQNASPLSPTSSWTQATAGSLVAGRLVQFSGSGDGNLTAVIQHPGPSANPDGSLNPERVTQYLYDWRDREVAEKDGVQAVEDAGTNRPIFYFTLDNLGEVTETDQFDGDGVPLSDFANGLSGLTTAEQADLVARGQSFYDELGQLYKHQVFSVTSGGTVGSALTTNFYYDLNGNLLAESDPGGLVSKHQYDAANRDIKDSSTDGSLINGGSMSWTEAADGTNSNDVVIEQTINKLDADGNLIETIDRQRFDNDPPSAKGDLAGPSGGGLASRDYYRGLYYDAAGRLTASVDVGTNGGSAWTMPSTVPARSDTALVTSTSYLADTVQTVALGPGETTGNFTLTFNGQTASGIPVGATAALVQSDLAALSSIGSGNVSVTGPAGGPWVVRFIGSLAGANQPLMTASSQDSNGNPQAISAAASIAGGDAGLPQKVTDPRGIVATTDYDMLGRAVDTIAAFTNGVPTSTSDQTTKYTFDGIDDVLTLTAVQPSAANEVTSYLYGVGTTAGKDLFSKDLIKSVTYPDASQENYAFNLLGEESSYTDPNGTTHSYLRDVLGRLTSDAATVASGNPWGVD